MNDMRDKYGHWFDTGDGMRPVTGNNRAIIFITGFGFYQDLGDQLVNDAGEDAAAYFLGWCFDNDALRPRRSARDLSTVRQLLSNFDSKGGYVRAMLWDNTVLDNRTTAESVKFIAGLPRGAAILDRRTPLAGSHHQKVQVIVSGPKAKVPGRVAAYCGGMEINGGRLNSTATHDVHCKILGDAGNELLQVFFDRWNDHPNRRGHPLPKLTAQDPKTGTDLVQVCCTYPTFQAPSIYADIVKAQGAALQQALKAAKSPAAGDMRDGKEVRFYNFYKPEKGVQQISRAVAKAIREAKRYIYLEDQYLVNKWVGSELAKKLANPDSDFRIVILVPHPGEIDIEQAWQRRRDFLAPLRAVDGAQKRWRVLIRRADRPDSYVHSKTWIFDDELVITGSANADRRGYTYNSEANVVVAGDLTGARIPSYRATTVAQNLRCRLFAKHLGGRPGQYLEPMQAMERWFKELGQTNVVPIDHWANPGKPDKREEQLFKASMEWTEAGELARKALKYMESFGGAEDWLWDNIEDPDAQVPNP